MSGAAVSKKREVPSAHSPGAVQHTAAQVAAPATSTVGEEPTAKKQRTSLGSDAASISQSATQANQTAAAGAASDAIQRPLVQANGFSAVRREQSNDLAEIARLDDRTDEGERLEEAALHPNNGQVKNSPLIIYNSQHNIARKIVFLFLSKHALRLSGARSPGSHVISALYQGGKIPHPPTRKFSDINLMFLGPSFVDLREQTLSDLTDFLTSRDLPKATREKWQRSVFTSAGMTLAKMEKLPWLQCLREDLAYNQLHLLCIDEAHWGLNKDGTLHQFLGLVADSVETLQGQDPVGPNLLILAVSATIEVVSHALDPVERGKAMVDWVQLKESSQAHFFATPTYNPITSLKLANDPNLAALRTAEERSDAMGKQYRAAFKKWFSGLMPDRAAAPTTTAAASAASDGAQAAATVSGAELALQQLLPLNTISPSSALQRDHIVKICTAKEYDAEAAHNHMVVVRLASNAEVNSLAMFIEKHLARLARSLALSVQQFIPFEVVKLTQDSKIRDGLRSSQLSEKALRKLGLTGSTSPISAAQLENLPCLVLVNNKLGMGDRVPRTCTMWDLRRYPTVSPTSTALAANESTFIQDIGRCAGHNKKQATVLMAVQKPIEELQAAAEGEVLPAPPNAAVAAMTSGAAFAAGPTGAASTASILSKLGQLMPLQELRSSEYSFLRHHALLKMDGTLTAAHPNNSDNSDATLTRLRDYLILLRAEPQIGKTGAMLALVDILLSEHLHQPISSSNRRPSRNGSGFSASTAQPAEAAAAAAAAGSFRPSAEPSAAGPLTEWTKLIVSGVLALGPGATGEEYFHAIRNVFRERVNFAGYHQQILKSDYLQSLTQRIAESIDGLITQRALMKSEAVFKILDAGCGLHGVVNKINRVKLMKHKHKQEVHVYGTDCDELIRTRQGFLTAETDTTSVAATAAVVAGAAEAAGAGDQVLVVPATSGFLKFRPCVEDMASTAGLAAGHSFDVIVYSMSLFETNVTRHVRWAYERLRPDGKLFLADVKNRFQHDFLKRMAALGFSFDEQKDMPSSHYRDKHASENQSGV